MENSIETPLFLIPVLSGIIFILTGLLMYKFPPKSINSFYGYRTNNSMKNQERWDFAQKYSAVEMIKLASLLVLSGLFGFLIKLNEMAGMIIGLALMGLMVVVLFYKVEKAIKNKFGEKKKLA